MRPRPAFAVSMVAVSALLSACGGSSPHRLSAGTYTGAAQCTGADRRSNGQPIDRFDSSPRAVVRIDSAGRAASWTYFFLGHRNTVIQARAARPGQSFSYAAGQHIGKPGRTTVTVLDVSSARGAERLTASLDWASPSTGYVGSGTYDLRLRARGNGKLEYQAVKAVVKTPVRGASAADPVVRRTEACLGDLTAAKR